MWAAKEKMEVYGITDKGKVRTDNQDYFSIKRCDKKSCTVVALCDGMGGAQAGEIASELSNNTFTDYVYSKLTSRTIKNPDIKTILIDACEDANNTAFDYSKFDSSLFGMGTTLVGGVVWDDGNVSIVNIGDSRAYKLSQHDGEITQITTDHSLVENLVLSGILTKEQAKNHPQKNVITRAIGTEPTVETDYFETRLLEHDMLLLCSDGLTNYVNDEELFNAYIDCSDPKTYCQRMLELTFDRGAGDNITIIAVVN